MTSVRICIFSFVISRCRLLTRDCLQHKECAQLMFHTVLFAGAAVTSETRFLDASDPTGDFRVVLPRINGKLSGEPCTICSLR